MGKRTDSLDSSFYYLRVRQLTSITTTLMAAEMQEVKLSGNNHLSVFSLFLTFIFIVLIPFFLKKFQFTPTCLQFLLGGKESQVQKTLT